MSDDTKPIGWVRAARKAYETFPVAVRDRIGTALTIAAEGGKTDITKPLKGFGSGIMEIAARYRADARRHGGCGRAVGAPRVSEEIEDGDQDSEG